MQAPGDEAEAQGSERGGASRVPFDAVGLRSLRDGRPRDDHVRRPRRGLQGRGQRRPLRLRGKVSDHGSDVCFTRSLEEINILIVFSGLLTSVSINID